MIETEIDQQTQLYSQCRVCQNQIPFEYKSKFRESITKTLDKILNFGLSKEDVRMIANAFIKNNPTIKLEQLLFKYRLPSLRAISNIGY